LTHDAIGLAVRHEHFGEACCLHWQSRRSHLLKNVGNHILHYVATYQTTPLWEP